MAQKQIVCQFCEASTIIKWKCVNCDLILCEDCKTKIHTKIRSSEEHDIIDLKEFNTTSAVETIRTLELKNIPCTNHANEKCFIYCQDCEMLLCSSCLIESHANHKLGKIADLYQYKLQELKDLGGKSKQQVKLLSERENELDKMMSKGQKQYDEIKQKILQRDAEIKRDTTQQSEQLVKELDKLWKLTKDEITQKLGELRENKGNLSQLSSNIEETLLSQKARSIFTVCDTTKGLPALPTKPDISVKQIILSKSRPLETIVCLGSLRTVPELKVIQSYHSDLKSITRIKTMGDGTNILCCYSSEVVCKFELKDSKCLTTNVAENVEIIDMTITKQGTLLFPISNNSEVKCISNISTDTTIETFTSITPLYVRSIHATNRNVLIGFRDNGQNFPLTKDSRRGIIVQDYNGRHIRTLECDTNNDRLFSYPFAITTNFNDDICVVDRVNYNWVGRVVVLTELGAVKWTYEGHSTINSQKKFSPGSLVTTNEGFILVTDLYSNAIHMLSIDGDLLTSLNKTHGIERPLCVNIDKSGKLLIGCNSVGTIDKVAKLHVVEFTI